MNKAQFLVAILCIGAFFNPVQGQTVEEDSTETAVAAAIESVRSLEIESYQRFLREATVIVSTACNHRPWTEVATALDNQMLPLVTSARIGNPPNVAGETLDRQFLVRENAVQLANEQSMNAHIAISVRYTDGPDQNQIPGIAFHARVLLVDEIKSETKDVQENRYPKDTVLDLVLRSDEIKQEMERWPYIKAVYLSYGSSITRYGVYYGFDVTVEFAESLDNAKRGKRLYFTVPSGLGPAYREIPDGFDQQDSLGEVRRNGSNEWGRKSQESEHDRK